MAEITVDYYTTNDYKTNINREPSGKVSITPRGNGFEYKIVGKDGLFIMKVYALTKGGFSILTHPSLKGLFVFRDRLTSTIIFANSNESPLMFKKADAMRLYDFFADLIEWSPGALESGTAHPDLLAAQQRHTVTATPSAGGGGGSRRKRKTRKSRKSRK